MSEKRYKELAKIIRSGDPVSIEKAIVTLRSQEPLRGAILLMQELLDSDPGEELSTLISAFLNDMSIQEMAGEVIEAIDCSENESTRERLISSCWQSGIDYSGWIGKFVGYSATYSYMCALECYSVIEEWAGDPKESYRREW